MSSYSNPNYSPANAQQPSNMQAQGAGGWLSGVLGGQNAYVSNVAGPSAAAFQNQNYGQDANAYQGALSTAQQQADPVHAAMAQAAQANLAQSNQSRGQMQGLAGTLAQTAAGQGPSVASQQLTQGLQQQLQQQMAAAASTSGGGANPFLAQRQLSDQAAQAQQATNAAMGQQRAQEALTAQNNLGAVLGNINQGDMQSAQFQAGLQQQANMSNQGATNQFALANQQAQQQAIQNQNAASQFYASGLSGLDQQQTQNAMGYQNAALQNAQYNNSINSGVASANTAAGAQFANTLYQGISNAGATAAGLATKSDERAKTNIDRGGVGHDMDAFLGSLDPASWDYRNPQDGQGRHYGVMAQSTEKTDVGRSFTFEGEDGHKMLDMRKAGAVALAALAHLHRRQQRVEKSLAERALERA